MNTSDSWSWLMSKMMRVCTWILIGHGYLWLQIGVSTQMTNVSVFVADLRRIQPIGDKSGRASMSAGQSLRKTYTMEHSRELVESLWVLKMTWQIICFTEPCICRYDNHDDVDWYLMLMFCYLFFFATEMPWKEAKSLIVFRLILKMTFSMKLKSLRTLTKFSSHRETVSWMAWACYIFLKQTWCSYVLK